MNHERRLAIYWWQNNAHKLTPKQRRRDLHKTRRFSGILVERGSSATRGDSRAG